MKGWQAVGQDMYGFVVKVLGPEADQAEHERKQLRGYEKSEDK